MTDRAVLLSVAPEFADKIGAGTKTVELRRRFPDVTVGTWIYFYVTLPVGAVTGRARVAAIDVDEPGALWARHHAKAGLSRDRFIAYFAGCDRGFAVRLEGYEPLSPVALAALRLEFRGFVAPQSYRFLDDQAQAALVAPLNCIAQEQGIAS
jgi:predicted transcriptional regulator